MRESARRSIRWTDETRTKSAALRPAARGSGAAGRQHVIRAGDVVSAGLRAQGADENGARTRQAPRHGVAVAHHVLRREALRQGDGAIECVGQDDAAVVPERGPGRAGRRQLAFDLFATASARLMTGVNRIARASGSCSAWAIRSAAIHAGLPVDETTAISLGPAKKSMAQSEATLALAAAT
jgi:hypothetical protein